MKLHPEVQVLVDALDALSNHIQSIDEGWAARVRIATDEISKSDAHGLRRFLGFFGGMGSLNDLVLDADGDRLRRQAWTLANNLKD